MRKPALACSSVIPCGSIAATRAFCCGLRAIFVEMALGSASGVVATGGTGAGGVVVLVVSVPGTVGVVVLPLPVPVVAPAPGAVVDVEAVVSVDDFFPDATADLPLPDATVVDWPLPEATSVD